MADARAGALSIQGPDISVESSKPQISVVRVRKPGAKVLAQLSGVFEGWPPTANTSVNDVYWLSPQEFAVLGRPYADVASRVRSACAGTNHHVADLGGGATLWHVLGAKAADVLARGCSLDLHASAFPGGRCAQTLFAQISVLVARPDAGAGFALIADASYDGHLKAWFSSVAADGESMA